MPLAVSPARYLSLHHFAFFRGYLEGLPLASLAERYLETGLDLRRAKTTVHWIRDVLLAVARRTSPASTARLLRLPPHALPAVETDPPPSLEAFAEMQGWEAFSEQELIELYQHHYAASGHRRAQRHRRLREKQLAALRTLEALSVVSPAPSHQIAGWFDPLIAHKLTARGLSSLAELVDFINRHGARWWMRVPKLGVKTADRIHHWLTQFGGEAGQRLQAHAVLPRCRWPTVQWAAQRPACTGLVPLEYFRLPAELDGSAGRNRGPRERNQTGACNDYEAICAWLRTREAHPHTWRSYRTQAERFLLWAILKKHKALSDLNVVDCIDYREFLAHLDDEPDWLGPRRIERWSADWRPFDGPLSVASQHLALTVLQAMCEWLKRQRYLETNPFDGVPARPGAPTGIQTSRSLDPAQWRYLLHFLQTLPDTAATARLRFVLLLAYGTGLRLSEMASATTGALHCRDLSAQVRQAWLLTVIGKRQRAREVPLPAPLMSALTAYFAHRGLPADPRLCPPDTPLIGGLQPPHRALAPIGLARLFRAGFARAARALAGQEPGQAARLRQASAHWLRHTHATQAIAAGTALDIVKENLGHQSLQTTTIYVTAEMARRYQAMEDFLSIG